MYIFWWQDGVQDRGRWAHGIQEDARTRTQLAQQARGIGRQQARRFDAAQPLRHAQQDLAQLAVVVRLGRRRAKEGGCGHAHWSTHGACTKAKRACAAHPVGGGGRASSQVALQVGLLLPERIGRRVDPPGPALGSQQRVQLRAPKEERGERTGLVVK